MAATTLTKKGQVTIPKEIRELLGLKERDKVLFIEQGGVVVVKPMKGNVLDVRGSVPARHRPEDFNVVRERVKQSVAARRIGKHG